MKDFVESRLGKVLYPYLTNRKESFEVKKGFSLHLLVLLIFISHAALTEGGEDSFSPKAMIQLIKDKKGAPNFCLEDLNGKKVYLKNFKGKVVFVNFWATWCGPCKEEMPSMESLYKQFKEREFVVLAVSVDYAGAKPVKEFMEKHQYTFPVLLDPKLNVLDLYEAKEIPVTFIIDKKGRMVGKAIGPRNWKSSEILSLVDQLLKE